MVFEGSFKRVGVVRTFMQNWVGHQTDLANLLFFASSHIIVQGNVVIDITAVFLRCFFQNITNPMH